MIVLACGGCVLQLAGCLTATVPGVVSFVESSALAAIFQGILP